MLQAAALTHVIAVRAGPSPVSRTRSRPDDGAGRQGKSPAVPPGFELRPDRAVGGRGRKHHEKCAEKREPNTHGTILSSIDGG